MSPLLLSFLSLSHMIVPERSLANTSFLFNLSVHTNVQETANNMVTNMEINTPRDWFSLSSTNSSKVMLVLLNVLSTEYTE